MRRGRIVGVEDICRIAETLFSLQTKRAVANTALLTDLPAISAMPFLRPKNALKIFDKVFQFNYINLLNIFCLVINRNSTLV